MKNKSNVLIIIILFFIVFYSCSKKDTPSLPENNYTSTITPTITETPTPLIIANFENSNCYTNIICSDCDNYIRGALMSGIGNYSKGCINLSGEPPQFETRACSVSATAVDDNNQWFAIFPTTFSTTTTGSNFNVYNKIKFNYKIITNAPTQDVVNLDLTIHTTKIDRLEKDNITLDRSGNWTEVIDDLTTFNPIYFSYHSISEILGDVKEIGFYFKISGDGTNSCFTEVIIDNIILLYQ
ncbi:MAG: hypothetical protein KA120_09610 [Candidatus Goldbacteria bacterium]|nr:hypothetical protein [Candidatus Goldiibacteriota bacterium]